MATLRRILASGIFAMRLWSADATFTPQTTGATSTMRGVSAVNAQVCWAGGTGGTVLRTVDGGEHWQVMQVPGAEKLDFRDVEAIDADTAYLLSIGPGEQSRIYKTTDAGAHWNLQFTNPDPKGFFDGFAFWDAKHGILFGDPVDGRFVIAFTTDGETWSKLNPKMPPALENEGAFAASGTTIAASGKRDAWFATGGARAARVFSSHDGGATWTASETPIKNSQQMSGIFGMAISGKTRIAVGGNDKQVDDASGNVAIMEGAGNWQAPAGAPPSGFRSAVAYVPGKRNTLVTVGRNGADFSEDGGKSWKNVGHTGYHALSFGKRDSVGWAVGDKGRLAKVDVK